MVHVGMKLKQKLKIKITLIIRQFLKHYATLSLTEAKILIILGEKFPQNTQKTEA
jgi:hypothetical protein